VVAERVATISTQASAATPDEIDAWIHDLAKQNRQTHDAECINLNPATNTMNPRAEALLSSGLGARPSLGYPGDKYEMGLEAIEQIEVVAAELAGQVFGANFAEIRLASGAMANLYGFMATCSPGDAIIVPPASIGGHVTHNRAGAAGLYGLDIHEAPIDANRYTVDVDALAAMAAKVQPKLITIGSSLNLFHHPVAGVRDVADSVGAKVLFDAAHLSGPIAGGAWPDPLTEGAHMMTMSTYKSLGGPPAGLLMTNDTGIAERVDAIAYPGLTANFDVAKSAALAVGLLDWISHGNAYAQAMVTAARLLAGALIDQGVPVHTSPASHEFGATQSHAFAIDASAWGGGHAGAQRLRQANLLTCAIGLPHDDGAGLRFGTNEVVRWGAGPDHMDGLATLITRALNEDPKSVAPDATAWRRGFDQLHFIRS